MTTEQIGYYAKHKDTGNFFEFSWSADDDLLLKDDKDLYILAENKNDYEIVNLAIIKN